MIEDVTEQVFTELPEGIRTILESVADTVVLQGEAAEDFLAAAREPALQPHEELLGRRDAAHRRNPLPLELGPRGFALGRVWVRRYTPPLSKGQD